MREKPHKREIYNCSKPSAEVHSYWRETSHANYMREDFLIHVAFDDIYVFM